MSSTRASLRRSRRAPRKQSSDYNVGDLVEINRNNSVQRARLAQLLTEGSSVHPRWLVKFEGPYKDEEVYEHIFSKVFPAPTDPLTGSNPSALEEASRQSPVPSPSAPTKEVQPKTDSADPSPAPPGADIPTNTSSSSLNGQEKKPAGSSQGSASPNLSDESSSMPETDGAAQEPGKKRKVSAREQRSRRRQAMIDEFGAALVSPPSHPQSGGGKRKQNGKSSKSKRLRHEDDGKCLKIKLLTGTLYMYRGRHRRAEFVRRV